MLPFIAVTTGEFINHWAPWAPLVHGQSCTYVEAVVRAGGAPLLIPLVDDETVLRQLYDQCAGVLLTGGNDLDPTVYKALPLPQTSNTCPRRDKQELQLLAWALSDDKPVLGICRGLQVINVSLGGSLYQDVAAQVPGAKDHQLSEYKQSFTHLAHRLHIKAGSQLTVILGTNSVDTNALHHQAIDRLGEGLVITAQTKDGVIEAVELPGKRFVIGVQSHPEALEATAEPRWQQLFGAFVDSAAGN